MTDHANIVSDYGWRSAASKPSQVYLSKLILGILRKLNAQRILDLGCGNGAMSHYLQSQGFSVVGCDADRKAMEIAALGNSGAVFSQGLSSKYIFRT